MPPRVVHRPMNPVSGQESGPPAGTPLFGSARGAGRAYGLRVPGLRPSSGARPSAGGDLARLLWPVAVAAVVALAVGMVALAGWLLARRNEPVSPLDGRLSIEVPESWPERSDIPFPGRQDPRDGVRVSSGSRSISAAFSSRYESAQAVLDRVRPTGCASKGTSVVKVDGRSGLSEVFTSCRGGVDINEVALAVRGDPDWTVWIEIRSTGGNPDLSQILESVRIDP